jgi:hypothetical protein
MEFEAIQLEAIGFIGDSEAYKQHRKLQNRKNQRARRESFNRYHFFSSRQCLQITSGQRLKNNDTKKDNETPVFEIKRWRVDEIEDSAFQDGDADRALVTSFQTSHSTTKHPRTRKSPQAARCDGELRVISPKPKPANTVFRLPSDHLLHLVQYNVFRAFVSIKRMLKTVSLDPSTCPVFGPCLDDTTRYPPNPNIPSLFTPTALQQTQYHFPWINIMPYARFRDNLIQREGHFDTWELWHDLVGDNMTFSVEAWQRGPSVSFKNDVAGRQQSTTVMSHVYTDADEVTAGRNGLIIWGEPHDMQSWEATPGFIAKWPWAVECCMELIESSNRWRTKRGENPIQLPV